MSRSNDSGPKATKRGFGKRKPWSTPKLTHHGPFAKVIRGGGGKLSISVDGDGRKPSGGG